MIDFADSLLGFTQFGFSLLAEAIPDAAEVADAAGKAADAATKEKSPPLWSMPGFFTFLMLVLLQVVLGFDNLLYISIESKRVEEDKQSFVRKTGIGLAIIFRIILLFVVLSLIKMLQKPFVELKDALGFITTHINGHSLIVLFGGAFILWTALKEIYHLLAVDDLDGGEEKKAGSVNKAIAMIVIMNLVFSFDSILSALALTDDFITIAAAIVVSGAMMIFLADTVAEFLKKNRMYEVLGLFVLFIVGIMLVGEGGHLAKLELFGYHVEPMAKTTFYFSLVVLILVDVVQSKYQRNLLAQKEARKEADAA